MNSGKLLVLKHYRMFPY